MFVPYSNNTQGYDIPKSLRLRSSASADLTQSAITATDPLKFTVSKWVKRGSLGTIQYLLNCRLGAAGFLRGGISFTASDQINYTAANTSDTVYISCITNAVFRDPAAWYHIVLVYDSAQATSSDRLKLWVNGVLQSFGTATYPTLNANSGLVQNTAPKTIGRPGGVASNYFDGYLSEINFIDGQALDPSYFGKTDPVIGAWVPKKYTGAYGLSGFYLDFKDGTSLTTLGQDKSGNGNNWTLNNVSLTSGTTYDWMDDTPTNNFATLNPLSGNVGTVSAANLSLAGTAAAWQSRLASIAVSSGKWYWEVVYTAAITGTGIGIDLSSVNYTSGQYPGAPGTAGYAYNSNNGNKYSSVGNSAYGATYTAGDIIGVALDLDAGTLEFFKNGVSQGVAFTGISGTFAPALGCFGSGNTAHFNLGQRPFAYTPPAGFKALCTKNLPTPTIKNGRRYFDAVTYTGTGAADRALSGFQFAPDLGWFKQRNAVQSHQLSDTVRGALKGLASDSTSAENTFDAVRSFTSDGFTLGISATVNTSAASYVSWAWKRSAISGFDIVTYTGTGVARTVAHGLGVAPKFIIIKRRDSTGNWMVYHAGNTASPATQAIYLNLTNATATTSTPFNNTAPTSAEFTLGTATDVNANGADYVAYLWTEVPGFSKFGSYTGNGSADGPFVWCGFRPRWVLYKRTNSTGNWNILDIARSTVNVSQTELIANGAGAEFTSVNASVDVLSNGFKLRTTDADRNASGGTYIFVAFAEYPFKYANAR